MSDQEEAAGSGGSVGDAATEPTPSPRQPDIADFDATDIEAPIVAIRKASPGALESAYWDAAKASPDRSPQQAVYYLLAAACSVHLRIDETGEPFGPKFEMDGRRSAVPSDWQGNQNAVLSSVLERIRHPGLRARLADIVWYNDRKQGKARQIAVEAYCEAAEGLRSGKYEDRFSESRAEISREEVDLITRAVAVARNSTRRQSSLPDRIQTNLSEMYNRARDHRDTDSLARIAKIRFRHSLIDDSQLAADLEAVALAAAEMHDYPLSIKQLWDLAAAAHDNRGDKAEQRRCLLAGVEQTLEMGKHVHPGSAQAHWIRTAISELRNIEDTAEKREELRLEMRRIQEKSLDEMGTFSFPVDFSEEVNSVVSAFETYSLPEAIKRFSMLQRPRKIEDLRQKALDTLRDGPIHLMFGATHTDEDGKVVAEVDGAPIRDMPSDEWIKGQISKEEEYTRFHWVNAAINPARVVISSNYPIEKRHLDPICLCSPLIPSTHVDVMALGFSRFIQGDYISAAYMLIPQIENCIRYALRNANIASSKIMQDMLQEDRSLSAILEKYQTELNALFTPYFVLQMDLLFNFRPGPALRHEMAHGKVGTGFCYHPDAVYACWFILHLSCIPLLSRWETVIGPAISS